MDAIANTLERFAVELGRIHDRLDKISPEFELLNDGQAAARFGLSPRKVAELRNSPNGPRVAVDGNDPRVSLSEWIAFFQREERRKGVRQ